MTDPQYLRELLRANLFDGYEGGTVTLPVAQLLTDIVDILTEAEAADAYPGLEAIIEQAAQPAPLDLTAVPAADMTNEQYRVWKAAGFPTKGPLMQPAREDSDD